MRTNFIFRFESVGAVALAALLGLSGRASAEEPAPPASSESTAADGKAACIAAFDQAQRDRAASHLLASQKQLLECSRPACGVTLMSECTQMYTDIERALPSVVLSAHDEAREVDLTAVEVAIDGKPFSPSIDGRPIPLDPGKYEFTFTAVGHAPIRREAVIGTGDKYRLISVVFPAADQPGPQQKLAQSGVEAPRARGIPVMSYVFGGLSLASLGTFGVLRFIASSDFETLKDGCSATGCPESDISNLRQKFVFSNIALGVGVGAAAGAVLWYVLDSEPSEPSTEIGFTPSPSGDGGMATARGTF